MNEQKQSLETLQDIKRMMERSSKFISLSGWSGVSAGICALIGAWLASRQLNIWYTYGGGGDNNNAPLLTRLILIALGTFIAAFSSALMFSANKSKKNNIPLWGTTTARLLWNMLIPLLVGGIFLLRMLQLHQHQFIAPGCLLFYGLALVNASKYTLSEIRFLGYGQLILGIINLWLGKYGLYFWAAGFGVLHIIYGSMMWWKYDRHTK
jgi:hypothetical protein